MPTSPGERYMLTRTIRAVRVHEDPERFGLITKIPAGSVIVVHGEFEESGQISVEWEARCYALF